MNLKLLAICFISIILLSGLQAMACDHTITVDDISVKVDGVTINPVTTTIAVGTEVELSISTCSADSYCNEGCTLTYLWSAPGGSPSSGSGEDPLGTGILTFSSSFSTAGEITITVTGTCPGNDSGNPGDDGSGFATVTIKVAKVASVTTSSTNVCAGNDITLTAVANPSGETLGSLEWQKRIKGPKATDTWGSWVTAGSNPPVNPETVSESNPGYVEYRARNGSNDTWKTSPTITIVGVKKIMVAADSDDSFLNLNTSPADSLTVAKGADMVFKAVIEPSGAAWPSLPVWSGTSGASGSGETESLEFSTASANATSTFAVTATCGTSSATANVCVVDLSLLDITSKRTAPTAYAETNAYPILAGEHFDVGSTFEFALDLNGWPEPDFYLMCEVWDLDWGNEVADVGEGASMEHTVDSLTKGTFKVRFFYDDDNTGFSEDLFDFDGDPYVDSSAVEGKDVTVHTFTFAKSTAVGNIDVAAACENATKLILKKDGADDCRAATKIVASSDPVGSVNKLDGSEVRDPLSAKNLGGDEADFQGDIDWYVTSATADVYVCNSIRIYNDAGTAYVNVNGAHFYYDGGITFITEGFLQTGSFAHELGHKFGIGPNEHNTVTGFIMKQGNEDKKKLTIDEAEEFE